MQEVTEIKRANTEWPVLDVIKKRFSPRSFRKETLEPEEVKVLIEAASWAPSAMNEQPWRFVVALRNEGERFERLSNFLYDGNRVWAENAGALLLILGKTNYSFNGAENVNTMHDVGMASMNLLLQAADMDIYGHLMEGFDKRMVEEELSLSEDGLIPVTMLALGRLDRPEKLDEPYYSRETTPRARKPHDEIVLSLV